MKISVLTALGIMFVSLATYPVLAQVSAFEATVPFPFVVGNHTLPAGTYTVQRLMGKPKGTHALSVIVMKANDHHVYNVIVTATGEEHHATAKESKLIFTSFKGKEYLNRVWVAGDAVAHQLADVPPEVAALGATGEVIVTGLHYSKAK